MTVPVSEFPGLHSQHTTSTEEPWVLKRAWRILQWRNPTRGIHKCCWIWAGYIWPRRREMCTRKHTSREVRRCINALKDTQNVLLFMFCNVDCWLTLEEKCTLHHREDNGKYRRESWSLSWAGQWTQIELPLNLTTLTHTSDVILWLVHSNSNKHKCSCCQTRLTVK